MFFVRKKLFAVTCIVTLCLMNLALNKYNRNVYKWMTNVENLIVVKQDEFKDKVNTTQWIKVGDDDFFIFSVIGEQTSTSNTYSRWNSLVFTGLERGGIMKRKYKCCFKNSDGSFSSVISESKRYRPNGSHGNIIAGQVVCSISNVHPPEYATLVSADAFCYLDAVTYLTPIYRKRDPTTPKFAICGKMAFANKNGKELVEWMEFHLHFGGGPFIIYKYEDLNVNAVKVLEYYEKRGVMEKINVPLVPLLDKFPRMIGSQTKDSDQDDQVMNFDFQQRAAHFSSYAMIDTDEFLLPKVENITSYTQLVDYLFKEHPNAAYLTLRTEVHLRDWGKTDPYSNLLLGQYEYHTEPRSLTEKNIFLPQRIQLGTMWQHSATAVSGFVREFLDPKDAVLKHYRYCKARWFLASEGRIPCLNHFKKIRGYAMGKEANHIENNVLKVIKELGL